MEYFRKVLSKFRRSKKNSDPGRDVLSSSNIRILEQSNGENSNNERDQHCDESTSVKYVDTEENLDRVFQEYKRPFGRDNGLEAGCRPFYRTCSIGSHLNARSGKSVLSQSDPSGYATVHGFESRQSDYDQTLKGSQPYSNSLQSLTSDEDAHQDNDTAGFNDKGVNFHIYGSCPSIQTNIGTGTDDYPMSRSSSRPQMVVVNSDSYLLKRIADRTKIQLRPFEDEKARVLTSVERLATEMLTRRKGNAIVVILGHEYDGKSYTAKSTMARLTHGWENAIINFPEELDEIQIDEDVRTCILKDDLFGKTEFSEKELEKWEPRFDEMLSKVRARKIGIIFAINKGVFESYTTQHNPHDIFNEENILDLTGMNRLSNDDKRGILKCQLQRFPEANVIFTSDIYEDNVHNFTTERTLYIYKGCLEQILEVPCTYGFPKQAERYASSLENIKRREKFFEQPMSFHCLTISKIRKSNEICDSQSAFAIETTFAMAGKVHIDMVTEQYQIIGDREYSESRAIKLLKFASSRRNAGIDPGDLFWKGFLRLKNWILCHNKDDNTIEFAAPVIYNATALVISKEYEEDVIKMAPWNFIEICISPEDERNKNMVLTVYKHPKKTPLKEQLYRRFYYEATYYCNVSGVYGHVLFKRKWFTDGLFEYLYKKRRMSEFKAAIERQIARSIELYSIYGNEFVVVPYAI